jgi:CheY-like chemotaxis protein
MVRDVYSRVIDSAFPDISVDSASNGLEAVEAFQETHYGIILMDIRMPVMNGDQAFKEIRKLCASMKWDEPNFIFCTGFDVPRDLAAEISSNDKHNVLSKPVSLVDVKTLIRDLRQQ